MGSSWSVRHPLMRYRLTAGTLAAFLLAFGGAFILHRDSALYDTDSYFHLAIARIYAEQGAVDELPELRMSLMRDGFGDKEFLFHALLAPWTAYFEPLTAGRLALAAWTGLIAAVLAAFALRLHGWWGLALPFWLFFACTEFDWRLVRLRPELLALVLFLAAAAAMAAQRDRLLGGVALLFTLGYTAFQALLGLIGMAFVFWGWKERRWPWRMLLYAFLGAGLGLLLHPHFPKNLEIWAVQNIQFFAAKGHLDVGTEIRPNFTDVVLMANLGFYLGLVVLVRSARRVDRPGTARPDAARTDAARTDAARTDAARTDEEQTDEGSSDLDRRLAEVLGIAAAVFAVLYLLMSRFALYFFPFAALWLLYELHRRKLRITAWTALPYRGRLPFAATALVCLLVSLPEAARQSATYRARTELGPENARIRDRELLSAALPAGGRVAADWGPTATYLLWAPQGRYLNALDPIFMALPQPAAHGLLRAVLAGREPDVPLSVSGGLESEHLAFPTVGHGPLLERLAGDPRVLFRHRGSHHLVGFVPPPEGMFLLDWRVAPEGREPPFDRALDAADWPNWPRAGDPALGALEAFVDARRIASGAPCTSFVHDFEIADPFARVFELAPAGATALWIDGALRLSVSDDLGAILGRGLRLPVELGAGRHRISVLTCESALGGRGFYLRRL